MFLNWDDSGRVTSHLAAFLGYGGTCRSTIHRAPNHLPCAGSSQIKRLTTHPSTRHPSLHLSDAVFNEGLISTLCRITRCVTPCKEKLFPPLSLHIILFHFAISFECRRKLSTQNILSQIPLPDDDAVAAASPTATRQSNRWRDPVSNTTCNLAKAFKLANHTTLASSGVSLPPADRSSSNIVVINCWPIIRVSWPFVFSSGRSTITPHLKDVHGHLLHVDHLLSTHPPGHVQMKASV